jgi:hypothetical protein
MARLLLPTIGEYVIDKSSILTCPDDLGREKLDQLLADLRERGYESEIDEAPDNTDPNRLVIDVPLIGFTDKAIENLRAIVASKSRLIQKALGTDSLRVDVTDDKLSFPWFILTGIEGEMNTYSRFVFALCEMAKTQKRVTAREREVENDKFAMRLFLIRLGFIGAKYKTARKILLRNLTGNSSWKSGQRPVQTENIEP